MASLVQRRRERMLAQRAALTPPKPRKASNDNALAEGPEEPQASAGKSRSAEETRLRERMGADIAKLKSFQSLESKLEAKAKMLPAYDAWADGVIAAATAAERKAELLATDELFVRSAIWSIDTGDWDRALPRARVLLRHGMKLPAQFERTPACMVTEEFAETALKAMAVDEAHVPDPKPLFDIAELVEDADMPDQVRAKLHKAIGMFIGRAADAAASDKARKLPAGGMKSAIEAALREFDRALALHEKVGVKKMIEQRKRQLKKLAEDQKD